MCNLSQEVMERGMEEGMQRGMEKGLIKGRAEGMVTSIKNLMDSMGWTIEQAMAALKISEADRPKYTKLLNS